MLCYESTVTKTLQVSVLSLMLHHEPIKPNVIYYVLVMPQNHTDCWIFIVVIIIITTSLQVNIELLLSVELCTHRRQIRLQRDSVFHSYKVASSSTVSPRDF